MVKRLTTEQDFQVLKPLVENFFNSVHPDYTQERFWDWIQIPTNYIVGLFNTEKKLISYVAFCYYPTLGRSNIFLFHAYATRGINCSELWKYLLKMSNTLNMPLIALSSRALPAMLRKYGFNKQSILIIRFPTEVSV